MSVGSGKWCCSVFLVSAHAGLNGGDYIGFMSRGQSQVGKCRQVTRSPTSLQIGGIMAASSSTCD